MRILRLMEHKPYHLLLATGDAAGSRLRAAFNVARFGHYFRTLTMMNSNTMHREWLYAVQDPLAQRCTLMKVRENEHDGMEQRSVVAENLHFIDALERMARFDSIAANPGMVPAVEDEHKTLQLSHYRIFANREGLAFNHDTHKFHATVDGHVVTTGLFNKSELRRIAAFSEQKHKKPDPYPAPAPQVMRENIVGATEKLLAFFKDEAQLKTVLALYTSLHQIERIWVDRNQRKFYTHSLEIASCDASFTNNTKDAFENRGRIDKARNKLIGDPYEGRQSAFFHAKIMERLRTIVFEHPELNARHKQALQDHEFSRDFALARRNAIQLSDDETMLQDKTEAAQFLKNRLASLDKIAAARGIGPEGIAGIHAVVYGGKLPAIFDDTAAFLKLLQNATQLYKDHLQKEQHRLRNLIP
jgi:hypothetical protein